MKEGHLQLLCCGRYSIQLLDNKLDTQLLKLMVPIELSILEEGSARRLIEEPVLGRFSYEPAAVDHILTLSGLYPYVVQYLCYELVERARNENRTTMTRDDVTAVMDVVQEPQGACCTAISRSSKMASRGDCCFRLRISLNGNARLCRGRRLSQIVKRRSAKA